VKKSSFLCRLVMIAAAALVLAPLMVGPVAADMLVVDVDTANALTDINATYWSGSDENNETDNGQLVNSDPDTEEAWLEALLGLVFDDPSVEYFDRIGAGNGGLGIDDKSINLNVGFSFEYAVVKHNGFWSAYQNDGDTTLTVPTTIAEYRNGISHISFFNGDNGNGHEVPEPATLLIVGGSLLGLALYSRRRLRR